MIAKHVAMKSVQKSSFVRLVNYLTNPKNKAERVGVIRITNCYSDNAKTAALEILNTQIQNKRSVSDKTYHLILSFRGNDKLSEDTLKEIENHFCKALGYGEHERVSVVHHDTDNLHIHLAINKVHPKTHRVHTPYMDYKTLADVCMVCERKFNLEIDNHEVRKSVREARIQDIESHSGVETLVTWIRNNCLTDLKSATSWQQVHSVLGAYGLKLQKRANGFIIAGADVAVKASLVHRELSKSSFEKRLGSFEEGETGALEVKKTYDRAPLAWGRETSLYGVYRQTRTARYITKNEELLRAKRRQKAEIRRLKRNAKMKRRLFRLAKNNRLLYRNNGKNLYKKIERVNERYFNEREKIYEKYGTSSWTSWLQREAQEGNFEALYTLRKRVSKEVLGDLFLGENTEEKLSFPHDSITKQGTVIYKVNDTTIRDYGDRFTLSGGFSDEVLVKAIKLSKEKYGSVLNITGSEEFKKRIVDTTIKYRDRLGDVSFKDIGLETLRIYEGQKLQERRGLRI
jgi:Relaxase/Mobilisation nuclease domain/Large polyvalent protein-associated domain 7